MLLKDLQNIFHKELDAVYGKEEVDSFFFLCTEHYLNLPRFQLSLEPEFTLNKSETGIFFKVLEDLNQQKPIQYILGETEFYGLPFKVNENVLIPRPETEELVDLIIKYHSEQSEESQLRILDIGTGSGCIAISLAKNLPSAEVYALDVSEDALKIAKQNADLNNVSINFIETDILKISNDSFFWKDITLQQKRLVFDIIVSNPPYVRNLEKQEIKPNVLDNEPHLALFVEDDNPLLFYKEITNFAIDNLKPKGELYFEINQYLGHETKALLVNANFENMELLKDLNGNDRMLKGRKKSKMKSISVFCGSSEGNDNEIITEAYLLGNTLAKENITLVYGAAKIGIMGKVAQGVIDNSGKTIGVIPVFLKTKEIVHAELTELITTNNMHDRKVVMYERSDGFIIIPGGFGTMDEFFEITTWGQLGLHTKPIGILNTNGYYDALINQCKVMVERGFLKQENFDAVVVDTTIEGLLEKMNNYIPLPTPKWLNKEGL
ncbi:putative protoporphyrinogen oxidase [Flavobacteriales bacterium ALC-1]|nr:putative protoporphyrinogen oxidase [Flavobacteriales bacterium ALC-1]